MLFNCCEQTEQYKASYIDGGEEITQIVLYVYTVINRIKARVVTSPLNFAPSPPLFIQYT